MSQLPKVEERVRKAYNKFENPHFGFSGGKESTILAYFAAKLENSNIFMVDNGYHFEETLDYAKRFEEEYGVNIQIIDSEIKSASPEKNPKEYIIKTERDAYLRYVAENDIDALIMGDRDQEAEENIPLKSHIDWHTRPEYHHTRYFPVFDLTEKQVWRFIIENDIPYNSLYDKGYRRIFYNFISEKEFEEPAHKHVLD